MSIRAPSLSTIAAPRLGTSVALGALICALAPLGCLSESPDDPGGDGEVAEASQAVVSPLPPSLTQSPIAIRANPNQQYVSATSGGAGALSALAPTVGTWEKFQIYDIGGGNVALKSLVNNKYVTATSAGAGPLTAMASVVDSWEKFRFVPLGPTTFALQALVNGKYVSAEDAGWGPLTANRTAVGTWETFSWLPSAVLQNQIAIRANVNGKYVSALYGGAGPLTASGAAPGSWETMAVKDLGGGKVAIKALTNSLWVSALSAGAGPLTASGAAPSSWETFQWEPLGGTNFALKSLTNNRYVSATSAGAGPLTAVATVASTWESFSWTVMPNTGSPNSSMAETFGENLALAKPTSQSSTWRDDEGESWRAVDGSTDGAWNNGHGSVTHTGENDAAPWWQVDLGSSQPISSVVLHNRTDCCSDRLKNFKVLVSNDGSQWLTAATYPGIAPTKTSFSLVGNYRYVRVQLNDPGILSLAEVQVLSRSTPTFSAETVYNFGNTVTKTFTGDFNGDGLSDIGVTGTDAQGDRNWTIRYGDGHGNFGNQTTWYWGNGVTNAFTGDFNGDGLWDIGVTGGQYDGDRNWYIQYGDGHGNFSNQTVYRWGYGGANGSTNVFTGDFNGDGLWDIGVTGTRTEADRTWYIMYGDGSGSFGQQTAYVWGNPVTNVFTGDFDGDGKWDIGTTGTAEESDRNWHIRFGDGRGSFGSESVYNWGNTVTNIFTGDFNGDHRTDIGVTGTASQAARTWSIRYNSDADALVAPHNCGPSTGQQSLSSQTEHWGDSTFAAGYSLQLGVGNQASTGHDTWMGARANGNVTMFGSSVDVMDMGVQATVDGATRGSRGWFSVVGYSMLDQSLFSGIDFHPSVTFAHAEMAIGPVTVAADAIGSIGVSGKATSNATGLSLSATPSVKISVAGSVSVGAACVSAGAYARLTLLNLGLPTNGAVTLFDSSRGWAFDSDLALSTLDGGFSLEVNYCVDSMSYDIFSWSGVSTTIPIKSGSGCQ